MSAVQRTLLAKQAEDNGFSIDKGDSRGWAIFEAHATRSRLALCSSETGTFSLGTSHAGVAKELEGFLSRSETPHDGFHCFEIKSSADLFRTIGRVWHLSKSLPTEPLSEFKRLLEEEVSTTEVERLRKERIGQNVFREALLDYWDACCAVTGVNNPTLLRASHIIPWSKCETDAERLNVHNGVLLVGTLDLAFDDGLISFSDEGNILISTELTDADKAAAGIHDGLKLRRINDEIRKRLEWHRKNWFRPRS